MIFDKVHFGSPFLPFLSFLSQKMAWKLFPSPQIATDRKRIAELDQAFEDEAVRCRENTADAWLTWVGGCEGDAEGGYLIYG